MDGKQSNPLSVLKLATPICVHGPLARQGGSAASKASVSAHRHKEATLESSAADISKETLIRAMFPPREWTDSKGNTWLSFPSSELPTRDSAIAAQDHLERELHRRQARPEPLDDVREEIFAEVFDELIRQIALLSPERGLLLLRVRDERRLTLLSLAALAQGGSRFGSNAIERVRKRGFRVAEDAGTELTSMSTTGEGAVLAALTGDVVSKAPHKASIGPFSGAGAAGDSGRHGVLDASDAIRPDHRGRGVLPARAALVSRLWPHNDPITRAAAEAAATERFGEEEAQLLFELVRRAAAMDVLGGTAAASAAGSAATSAGEVTVLDALEGSGAVEIGAEGKEGGDSSPAAAEGGAGAVDHALAAVLPVDPEEARLSRRVVGLQRDVDSLRARKAELESLMQAVGARARARRQAVARVQQQEAAEEADEAGIGMGLLSGAASKAPSALAAALRASDASSGRRGGGGDGAIMEQQLALQLQRRAQKARLESQIEALKTVLSRADAAAAAAGEGMGDDESDTGLDIATGLGPEPSLDSAVGLDG